MVTHQRGQAESHPAQTSHYTSSQWLTLTGDYQGNSILEVMDGNTATHRRAIQARAANIQEAIALHLEGEDLAEAGISPDPTILATNPVRFRRGLRVNPRHLRIYWGYKQC